MGLSVGILGEEAASWNWPVDADRYGQSRLSEHERTVLEELELRRHGHRDDGELWRPIGRLLRPLEDTHAGM
ncbi:hypothetical protein AB0B56_31745 [Streptosporangium canum]|uniref:hypothetical protein n=1 Tax=Streptosporangium canum TaxID=324952 RepID=UPI003438762D